MMMPGDITTDLLQDLTDVDVDSIWKLLFWATGTTRNTKVPTLHKYSFLKLLVDLHDSWGRRLATIDWQTVDRVSGFDWSLCEYELVVEAKLIKTIRHRDSGKTYDLPRPLPSTFVLQKNWLQEEAVLVDPEGVEDDFNIRKRFGQNLQPLHIWSPEEIKSAEKDKGLLCVCTHMPSQTTFVVYCIRGIVGAGLLSHRRYGCLGLRSVVHCGKRSGLEMEKGFCFPPTRARGKKCMCHLLSKKQRSHGLTWKMFVLSTGNLSVFQRMCVRFPCVAWGRGRLDIVEIHDHSPESTVSRSVRLAGFDIVGAQRSRHLASLSVSSLNGKGSIMSTLRR